jgi:hypothetical protein
VPSVLAANLTRLTNTVRERGGVRERSGVHDRRSSDALQARERPVHSGG